MDFFNQLMNEFDKDELNTFTKLIEKFNGIADSKIQKMLGKDGHKNTGKLKENC